MSEFKGTKGKWERVLLEKTDFYTRRNEIHYGNVGECVAEFVHDDYDALLISKAREMLDMLNKIAPTLERYGEIEQHKEVIELIKEATEL
jgi:hypothetical protein